MAETPAKTYDEIVRATVPEPDSGYRPTPEQIRDGLAGVRVQDSDERALQARVVAAIGGIAGIAIEVEHTQVRLSGRVKDAASLRELEGRLATVDGIGILDNRVVVGG